MVSLGMLWWSKLFYCLLLCRYNTICMWKAFVVSEQSCTTRVQGVNWCHSGINWPGIQMYRRSKGVQSVVSIEKLMTLTHISKMLFFIKCIKDACYSLCSAAKILNWLFPLHIWQYRSTFPPQVSTFHNIFQVVSSDFKEQSHEIWIPE